MRRVGIVLLVLLAAACSRSGPSKADAYKACQGFINEKLKAPATAKYPPLGTKGVAVTFDGDTAYVGGFVDSENGFGALLRLKLVCTMKHKDGEWTTNPNPALTFTLDPES